MNAPTRIIAILDAFAADQSESVGLVQREVERQCGHLFRLDVGDLGNGLPGHLVALDVVVRLFPFDPAAALPEIVAVDRHVDGRPPQGEFEMEIDPCPGGPAFQGVVLDFLHLRRQRCPAPVVKKPAGIQRRDGIPEAPKRTIG